MRWHFTLFSCGWWYHFCWYTNSTLKPAAAIVVIHSNHPNICQNQNENQIRHLINWTVSAYRNLLLQSGQPYLVLDRFCFGAANLYIFRRNKLEVIKQSNVINNVIKKRAEFCTNNDSIKFNAVYFSKKSSIIRGSSTFMSHKSETGLGDGNVWDSQEKKSENLFGIWTISFNRKPLRSPTCPHVSSPLLRRILNKNQSNIFYALHVMNFTLEIS